MSTNGITEKLEGDVDYKDVAVSLYEGGEKISEAMFDAVKRVIGADGEYCETFDFVKEEWDTLEYVTGDWALSNQGKNLKSPSEILGETLHDAVKSGYTPWFEVDDVPNDAIEVIFNDGSTLTKPLLVAKSFDVSIHGENVPIAYKKAPSIESCILSEKLTQDMVKKPNHYQLLPNYEVKDVNKALLDKIETSDFEMTLYEAGWYQQSMQYFMRFYAKNGLEDLEKGVQTMQFAIDSIKQRKDNQ